MESLTERARWSSMAAVMVCCMGRTGKEGDSRGQLKAWQLAVRKGILNLFHERDGSKMRGSKVTGGGGQGAKESSGSSGHHAAKTKHQVSAKSKQGKHFYWERVLIQT